MANKTIVVKLGTSVLTGGSQSLHRAHMLEFVRQCAKIKDHGTQIIVVTSGAIAAGREHLNYPQLPSTIASKQLLAAVGQIKLIQLWEQLFSIYRLNIGQMLLTRADLEDKERFLNARDTLRALIKQDIIPVINENDAVATTEIKVGDNDNLSALVAILADAQKLLLLTDQAGLFTADPRTSKNAKLINIVDSIDENLRQIAGDSFSGLGTGGMATKLQAAEIANRAGIDVIVAAGERPNVIADALENKIVGTHFRAQSTPLENRKRWILGALSMGAIIIDSGAEIAILNQGGSLLPSGVIFIEGIFSRGEVVKIARQSGQEIARGVACYGSDALKMIAGHHSQAIHQILGYEYGSVAVHRDDMVLM